LGGDKNEISHYSYIKIQNMKYSEHNQRIVMRKLHYTNVRSCKDYEKPWKNFCIDKGIENDWMETLCLLKIFDLVKICEGHEKRRGIPEQFPHLDLISKIDLDFYMGLDENHNFLTDSNKLISEIFNPAFFYIETKMPFRTKVREDKARLQPFEISITTSQEPFSGKIDAKSEWLKMAVQNVVEYDRRLNLLLTNFTNLN
jgi:hypothetical protein